MFRISWPASGGLPGEFGLSFLFDEFSFPSGNVIEIIRRHLAASDDVNLLHRIALGQTHTFLVPNDGRDSAFEQVGNVLKRQPFLNSPRSELHDDQPLGRKFPLWLSQVMAMWQYANMETSRIGYLRRVANENHAPNRIRELREAKGLNQAQLAALANVTPSALNKLELGHRGLDLDWMLRLAPLLDCSAADLLPDFANPYRLRDREKQVVERMRAASSKELETFDKVADALLPQPPDREDRAA